MTINHVYNANDVVRLAKSTKVNQSLINVCERFILHPNKLSELYIRIFIRLSKQLNIISSIYQQ